MSDDFTQDSENQDIDGDIDSTIKETPKLDTDISGMDPQAAKEYVLHFIVALKETQKQIQSSRSERELWEKRVNLARENHKSDLEIQAQERVNDIQTKIESLNKEEEELRGKVLVLKDELKKLVTGPQLTVDADALLAQMEMIVGEPDKTKNAFKEFETDVELNKLKKKTDNHTT